MKRIVVFASGQGTNAVNLIRFFGNQPDARVTWVVTNRKDAPVLQLTSGLGIEATYFPPEAWRDGTVLKELISRKTDLIVLAGFLKLVPEPIIHHFRNRIINIHPALLPAYGGHGMYGMNVHQAVASSGDIESGITIHFVNEYFDEGEVIAQFKVPIQDTRDPQIIQSRVRELEIKYFPQTVLKVLQQLPVD
jgi:phosphoribosylglycinamide formyltransferase-1